MTENGTANGYGDEHGEDGAANTPYLESLAQHVGLFQIDGFTKAYSGNAKKFSLFSRKPEKTSATDVSPQDTASVDGMLLYQSDEIPTSLLKLGSEGAARAIKMFQGIQSYTGEGGGFLSHQAKVETAQKLLQAGMKRTEMKDELFMQLLKQTRGNPNKVLALKTWDLFYLTASCLPPSKDFVGLVSEYVHTMAHNENDDADIRNMALKTWRSLKRSAKAGPRRLLPTAEEIDALLGDKKLTAIVFFLDETFEELVYDSTSTVAEAVEQIAGIIKLENYQTFTLFELRKPASQKNELGQQLMDEHMVLDDNRYIADVVFEFRNSRVKEFQPSKLLFKKRMFRETDETITEPQFINLSYVQAQHDYLQGSYPVVREDAAQMCALQMQAEFGPTLINNAEAIDTSLDKFIVKQVLMTRPREEWKHDVSARYKALEQFSKDDARLQLLRILRSLPYGNSIFFNVKRIEDPIGLLPQKLIIGINKRGVHFFRPIPKEYLHSAELRDIMQFGSSQTAVFFKMRVAGVLHIFQFDTKQGEDICMALQTHINDIMMKRYSKSKETSASGGGGGAADFKGDARVAELQKQLEAANKQIEELERKEKALVIEKSRLGEELLDAQDRMALQGKTLSDEDKERYAAAAAAATATRAAAAAAAAASSPDAAAAGGGDMLSEADAAEAAAVTAQLAAVEATLTGLRNDKELVEKKVERLTAAHAEELTKMRADLDEAQGGAKEQIVEKDGKISELIADLGKTQATLTDKEAELAGLANDIQELDALRELKADIERREKEQAQVINRQAKRLDELEILYREEAVARKKISNAMDDLKGKVRVFARVRPMLKAESDKGCAPGLTIPDELTVECVEDGVKKMFMFDNTFGPDITQAKVFDNTKQFMAAVVEGHVVNIGAYGCDGAGKTFTIFGNDADPGLVPRSVTELFNVMTAAAGTRSCSTSVSMVELYEGELVDLLPGASAKQLEIKKDTKGQVVVWGAHTTNVSSATDLMAQIEKGRAKHLASGHAPAKASVFINIFVDGSMLQGGTVSKGRLTFMDLAAADGCKKQGATGSGTNKPMSALGDVITALAEEKEHVPYSSDKLTMLLSDALGGISKTLMFVNVSPSDSVLAESLNCLTYANMANTITNVVTKLEFSKEVLKCLKQVDSVKEQAGVPKDKLAYVDLVDVPDKRQEQESNAQIVN